MKSHKAKSSEGVIMETNEVNFAFEILLEEIEVVVNALNEDGSEAFQKGNYDKARIVIEEATRLTTFREKVQSLQKEWEQLHVKKIFRSKTKKLIKRRSLETKLKKGLRTTEAAFYRPVLETLIELGGSAKMNEVIKKIEEKMSGIFTEYDYQPLSSNPKQIRWHNTVQWSRNTLVNKGLMKKDSPRGIWEISDAGIKNLRVAK